MPKAKMSKKPKKAAAPSKIAHRPSIPLTSLATELICAIFSLLSIADIGTLREVCARFRSIIKENLNDRLEGLIGPEHVILVPFRKGARDRASLLVPVPCNTVFPRSYLSSYIPLSESRCISISSTRL